MSTILPTPVQIPPTADHTTGGEIRIFAPNDTDFVTLIDTVNGFLIKGKTANNGSIVLEPGNVAGAGLASAAVVTPRLDQPGLIIFDASGTTTGNSLSLRTNGGTEYFAVKGGTDAAAPGEVTLHNAVTLDASGGTLIITGGNSVSFQGLVALSSLGDGGFKFTRGSVVRALLADTGGSGTGVGILALGDNLGAGSTGWKAPVTLSGGTVYTMPPADGGSGDVLSTDGALHTSWVPAGGGSGPWTVYTPTPTYTAGTITVSASNCAYVQSGKNVYVRIALTFTVGTNGITSSTISIPLPVTPKTNGQSLNSNFWFDSLYPAQTNPSVAILSGSAVLFALIPITVSFTTARINDVVITGVYEAN